MKQLTTTTNKHNQMVDGVLSLNAVRSDAGIQEAEFLSKEQKAELARNEHPFCIANIEIRDSEYNLKHGQFVYSVLIPNNDRMETRYFSLGWNEQRQLDYEACKATLSKQSHIHSCKLVTKGKAKPGRQPFYKIVEATDEDGCFYCIGCDEDLEHPTFPLWVSSEDTVEADEADELPATSKHKSIAEDLDI